MIRPEIQKFLDYIDRNIDDFKITELYNDINVGISGITNGIYDVCLYYIRNSPRPGIYSKTKLISINNDEGQSVHSRVQFIKKRDIDIPKSKMEKDFLEELSNLQ